METDPRVGGDSRVAARGVLGRRRRGRPAGRSLIYVAAAVGVLLFAVIWAYGLSYVYWHVIATGSR